MNRLNPYAPQLDGDPLDTLATRVRGEFLEMPGMTLTTQQAEQLWALDHDACERVLTALVEAGFLIRGTRNSYVRP